MRSSLRSRQKSELAIHGRVLPRGTDTEFGSAPTPEVHEHFHSDEGAVRSLNSQAQELLVHSPSWRAQLPQLVEWVSPIIAPWSAGALTVMAGCRTAEVRATTVPDTAVSHGQRGCLAVEFAAASPGIETPGHRHGLPPSLLKWLSNAVTESTPAGTLRPGRLPAGPLQGRVPGLSGTRVRPPGAPSCTDGVGRPESARPA